MMSAKAEQVFQLFFISLINIAVFLPFSVMGPIFPEEAISKGLSETTSGLIFSVFPLLNIITFPVAGYLIPRVGAKTLLISGLCLTGISQIGFGALNGIDDAILFTVYCFLIRSLTSIGAAICITCVTYQIFERFPEHLSLAFAVNETSIGIGQALGPQVAAICEAIGGYELPYYVTGVIPLLILPYLVCEASTPEAPKKATEPIDHWKLCSWELVPISVALIVIGVSFAGFPGPTIEPHLKEISLSGSIISLILSGLTITYTVSSLLIGKFADRYPEPKKLMLAGSIVTAVFYLCLGPSPFTRLTNSLDSNLVSMLALGASLGVTTVPSFGVLLQALKKIGYEDNERTLGLVSAFWLTVYTFGEFLGTSFSGFLVDRLGFVASTQIVASLNAISAALFFIQLSLTRNENKLPLIESVEY